MFASKRGAAESAARRTALGDRPRRRLRSGVRRSVVSVIAATLAAGALTVLVPQAAFAADLDDNHNPFTFNMQGSSNNAPTGDKWNTTIRRLMEHHDIGTLQEAGTPPGTLRGTFRRNGRTIHHYEWNIGTRTRPQTYHVYWVHTDTGANRVNLATIVRQELQPTQLNIVDGGPADSDARPSLGVRLGSTWFWNIHGWSGSGNDTQYTLERAAAASGGSDWVAMGDFNRLPDRARQAFQSRNHQWHLYAPSGQTQQSGNVLDYMVTPLDIDGYGASPIVNLDSDHVAVQFGRLRAAASQYFLFRNAFTHANLTFAEQGNNKGDLWAEEYHPGFWNTHWRLTEIGHTSKFTLTNQETGKCITRQYSPTSNSVIFMNSCTQEMAQQFDFYDAGRDGQIRIKAVNTNLCIGNDKDGYFATLESCTIPNSRWFFENNHPDADRSGVEVGF